MHVVGVLTKRGAADILIAVTDGLNGIGDALGAVFPATMPSGPRRCQQKRLCQSSIHQKSPNDNSMAPTGRLLLARCDFPASH
jgi:hypothetical protein